MKAIKQINVFTFGDSSLVRTWSNVPYLLTKTLEKKGYIVNRINIDPNRYLQAIYNRIIYKSSLLIKKDHVYLYERTYLNFILTFWRIKRYNRKFKGADLNIFTNFSFYNKYSKQPNILFCDWDLHIGINERLGRKPYYFEQTSINRQKNVIENADLVISLFPKSAQKMKMLYDNPNIHHLNQNVINSLYEKELIEEEIIKKKKNSFDLLFIGSKNYIEGAKLLIDAYSNLKEKYPELKVNIIGIEESEFENLPEGVEAYGYLDKNDENDRTLYYGLIINAKIFVNPTPVWGGYSSTIEAMYFYTPVVISPYEDFVEEFGSEILFGSYCLSFKASYLEKSLIFIIENQNYEEMCLMAHKAVSAYTWGNYVDTLMRTIDELHNK